MIHWTANRPHYQRLVLDQGYFPEGGYTAPNDEALRRDIELAKEMGFKIIAGDRNHPCIIVWTPVNESRGVPALRGAPDQRQVSFLKARYHPTKSLDPTRLVVRNDGWEHAETDLCTIHHYGDEARLRETFTDRQTAVRAPAADSAVLVGFCWTQLTYIQQEANGLLTKDRTPKVAVAAIREGTEQVRPRRLTQP